MAATNPIDISSSDSEFDIDDETEANVSSSRAIQDNDSNNDICSSDSEFDIDNYTEANVSSSRAIPDDTKRFTDNSRIVNGSGRDFEKLTSQQYVKRTPPQSLQLSQPRIRDAQGSSHNHAGPSSANSQGYIRDHIIRGSSDGVMEYETTSSRILPSSLMHGKSATHTLFASLDDSFYRPGITEERVPINDERVIYQAALEDLNQPRDETNLPDGLLSVPLLRHQKSALHWMLRRETRSGYCLGGILADDQGLGKTISMIALIQMQKFIESKSKSKSEKISSHKTVALNLVDDDDDNDNGNGGPEKVKQSGESNHTKFIPEVSTSTAAFSKKHRPPAGTLVVCPASVLRQWARECDDKVEEESKLSVLIYHGGSRTKDPSELAKYDVVLTTYSIVTNEVPKQPRVNEDENDEKNGERYGLFSEFSINRKRNNSDVGKKGKKGRKGIDGSAIDSGGGALARVNWFRVILDEAQTIKNHRTHVARSCCSLRAKRRWCLSGTPIQNAIDDLYSYFRFLKHDPYYHYKAFCNGIKNPISRDHVNGYRKLQAVLKTVMLRRTKATLIDGEPIVKLPPKSIDMTKVDFTVEERAFYTRLEADSRSQFKAYAAAGTVNQNYANILLMLLRLRQACGHPLLVKGFSSESIRNYDSDLIGKVSVEMAKTLPREMLINLLNCLESTLSICLVCKDPPDDPVVTMCGHVFCYQCVAEYLTGDDNTCPAQACKEQLGADIVFSKATIRNCVVDGHNGSPMRSRFEKSLVLCDEYSSSKIKALVEILQSKCLSKNSRQELHGSFGCNGTSLSSEQIFTEFGDSDSSVVKRTTVYSKSPPEGPMKAIIFSQWTGMLDLVERSLRTHNINYRRLDGTMTLAARDRAVKDFNTDPEVTAMLMSLKAGNLGLNMVAACHVILLDLWWNPTTEDQAIDRTHRIGQTRPVTVTRLTIKDTVEDRMLSLQDEKRKMVASAFGEDQSGGSATRLTLEDLSYLFMG